MKMAEMPDEVLATVIKAVSIRKQNLYRALTMSDPDSEKWKSINEQIVPVEEADTYLDAERNARREAQIPHG
jgi:hypothetical protein